MHDELEINFVLVKVNVPVVVCTVRKRFGKLRGSLMFKSVEVKSNSSDIERFFLLDDALDELIVLVVEEFAQKFS